MFEIARMKANPVFAYFIRNGVSGVKNCKDALSATPTRIFAVPTLKHAFEADHLKLSAS
jgi:hypothetical protein